VLHLRARRADAGQGVFHFRAPPSAAPALAHLGVDCVTLANNHALDFGPDPLLDTLAHLDATGIRAVGAGTDLEHARTPAMLEAGGFRLAVLGFADHPAEYAADANRPGIAYADLQDALPDWLTTFPDADAVLVTPHWGPNMSAEPQRDVRRAAHALMKAGATLVAGHSAHLFQGVAPRVLYVWGAKTLSARTFDVSRSSDQRCSCCTRRRSRNRLCNRPYRIRYSRRGRAGGAEVWRNGVLPVGLPKLGVLLANHGFRGRGPDFWRPTRRRSRWSSFATSSVTNTPMEGHPFHPARGLHRDLAQRCRSRAVRAPVLPSSRVGTHVEIDEVA
jgi:Bacterial capsule synthesis protein PGA_cap